MLTARRRKCTAAHAVKSEVDPSGNGATPEIIERIEERDIQKEASESFIAVSNAKDLCQLHIPCGSVILL